MLRILLLLYTCLSFIEIHAQSQNKLTKNFQTNKDSSLIIISVNIDGQSLPFLFDTGSRFSLLFDDGNYNLKKTQKVNGLDSYNNPTELYITKKKIIIPSLDVKYKGVCAIMKDIPDFLKELNIQGIIGADLINNFDWKIDFNNLKITRLEKNLVLPMDSFYTIETHINEQKQVLDTYVTINDSIMPFIFDSGMNSIINVNGTSKSLQNENIILKSFAYLHTISGNYVDTSYIGVNNISIGNIQIENIPLPYSTKKIDQNAIGMKFFRAFGEFYMLNSKNKILVPCIKSYQYGFESFKEKDGIIVSQRIPFDSDLPSHLGEKVSEIQGINKKEYKMPQTKYSFKSTNENNMPVHNSK